MSRGFSSTHVENLSHLFWTAGGSNQGISGDAYEWRDFGGGTFNQQCILAAERNPGGSFWKKNMAI